MKARRIQEMIRAKEQIERGAATPAKVWNVRPDGKGGFTRRAVDPKAFRRAQKASWDKSIAARGKNLAYHRAALPGCWASASVRCIIGNKAPARPAAPPACCCVWPRSIQKLSWKRRREKSCGFFYRIDSIAVST